jgi:hypothetical protein
MLWDIFLAVDRFFLASALDFIGVALAVTISFYLPSSKSSLFIRLHSSSSMAVKSLSIDLESFNAALLNEPWSNCLDLSLFLTEVLK